MRRLLLGALVAIVAFMAWPSRPRAQSAPIHILFVGNSLTYVGNLPGVLDAIAAANGRRLVSTMIVKGGGTLAERVADGSVTRALAADRYDLVVLQERGGDMICAFAPDACKTSEAALTVLVKAATRRGARPILLGTYQGDLEASQELVKAESIAKGLAVAYVPVSERFQAATRSAPAANWLYADHMHPGHDLVLLEAALLYRELFGALPHLSVLTVHAPMFGPHAKFFATVPSSHAPTAQGDAGAYTYSADETAVVLGIAAGKPR